MAEEIVEFVFPAGDESAEVGEPRKSALDFPSSAVPAEGSMVLSFSAASTVGRDQFDVVIFPPPIIVSIGIVGFVADQIAENPVLR